MQSQESYSREFPDADPNVLWALLADTNRTARAMGLVSGKFHEEKDAGGRPFQVGEGRQLGLNVAWVSGPDSWVEGRWYHAVRHYLKGPAKDSVMDFRLEPLGPKGQGCRVTVSRKLTGSLVAIAYDRFRAAPAMRRFLRESAAVAAKSKSKGVSWGDRAPAAAALGELLEGVPAGLLTGSSRPVNEAELALRLATLRERPVSQAIVERLVTALRVGADEEVADLQPLQLAVRWKQPRREVLRTFLYATHTGLLELHWNLRCQTCRTPAAEVTTLSELPDQTRCPGCGATFGPDLANHIEAAFSVHPAIRRAELHAYCTAGAALRPHVFAQLVATPEATCTVAAPLLGGDLLLRVMGQAETRIFVPPHAGKLDILVRPGAVSVDAGPPAPATGVSTQLTVRSELQGTPAVVLLERSGWSDDWVSAAALASVPEFHELFPGEAPRSRHEVSVGGITLLFTDLRGSTAMYQKVGDARAYTLVDDHFERLTRVIEENEGALIKTMGDAVMAVFQTSPAAVRAALAMHQAIAESESGAAGLVLKLGIHSGTCLAVRANDRLDFFGNAVNLAARAQGQSHGGDIVVTKSVIEHPEVAALLEGVTQEPFEVTLKGIATPQRLWRLEPKAKAQASEIPKSAVGSGG
jgi:class 3 adenylate cyclase